MEIVRLAAFVADLLLLVYILFLLARLILEYVTVFSPSWRPRGFALVVAEVVYTLTDPPLKFFRRLVRPLRIGPIALDLGFPLTMLACFVALAIVRVLQRI